MSKSFKTFIVILVVSLIASTSGQQDGNSTQLSVQDVGTQPIVANGSSGTGGGGLIDGIISIPATLLSFILSPIRALLSFILGSVGNLVGTILNLVFNLLRTILTPIFFLLGLPVDAIEDTLGGIGGGVGALVRGILSLVFTNILGINSPDAPAAPIAIAGPTVAPRVRRDLVMESIMDVASYVSSIISPFLLNLSDSTQDAAIDMLEWGWSWAKQVLLPRLDQFLISAKDSPWITENMAQWFSEIHTTYTWLHLFGIL